MRIKAFHEMQVGVAKAGDARADQDFARTRIGHADILDHQRLVDFKQNGGLHRVLPLSLLFLNQACCRQAAYAAIINSPTSAIPTARSPSKCSVIARCAAFSVSRNGSLAVTRWSITIRDNSSRLASPRISWMRPPSHVSATALATW